MMGRGPRGHHLFKGGPYQRILFELSFDGRMHSDVGKRIYDFASHCDLVLRSFAQVYRLPCLETVGAPIALEIGAVL